MTILELLAAVTTVASVALATRRQVALYPVGLLATGLYFFVFLDARLYSSAALQGYFTVLQLYGWWFWLRGDRGGPPQIGNWAWSKVALLLIPATVGTLAVSALLGVFTDAQLPIADSSILTLSVLAQFLLDRKQIKTWPIWIVVNVLSIGVYGSSGLWLTMALYLALLGNAFYGWWTWNRAFKAQSTA